MNLLLDTHVAIWAVSAPNRLPEAVQSLILDEANEIFVSVASIWEIAIKTPLKRFDPPPMTAADAAMEFERAGYRILDIVARHAQMVEKLPLLHGDPFDRLLVAQALVEPMHLVTHDRRLAGYGDGVISW